MWWSTDAPRGPPTLDIFTVDSELGHNSPSKAYVSFCLHPLPSKVVWSPFERNRKYIEWTSSDFGNYTRIPLGEAVGLLSLREASTMASVAIRLTIPRQLGSIRCHCCPSPIDVHVAALSVCREDVDVQSSHEATPPPSVIHSSLKSPRRS